MCRGQLIDEPQKQQLGTVVGRSGQRRICDRVSQCPKFLSFMGFESRIRGFDNCRDEHRTFSEALHPRFQLRDLVGEELEPFVSTLRDLWSDETHQRGHSRTSNRHNRCRSLHDLEYSIARLLLRRSFHMS